MNRNSTNTWSQGGLIQVAASLPPIEIDCSDWENDKPEQGSEGRFVSPAQSMPAAEQDFSATPVECALRLELRITFPPQTTPGAVILDTNVLLALLDAKLPDLRLTYDYRHSGSDGDKVIIALVPQNQQATEEMLQAALASLEPEFTRLLGARRTTAHIVRAA